MKLFLDSSKTSEIEQWKYVIDGITTNPSILLKDGGSIDGVFNALQGKPISVEAAGDFETEAREYTRKSRDAVVKIPLLRPDGGDNLSLISKLSSREGGIRINCTALFSLGQVILATKAGSRYVSIFAGRIDDEGGDFLSIVKDCADFIHNEPGRACELIVGSIRSVGMVRDCMRAGADIVTVPPDILRKMLTHNFSLKTVQQFEADAQKLKK